MQLRFENSDRNALGARLRAMRKSRNLTLTDLADRSELSFSAISKIERGVMAPTYDKLVQLARGLDVEVSALFADQSALWRPGTIASAYRGEYELQETPVYRYEMLFAALEGRSMAPMVGVIHARDASEFPDFIRHPGEEFIQVLEGAVRIIFEQAPAITLEEGESAYFDSSAGHIYVSLSEKDARILVVLA